MSDEAKTSGSAQNDKLGNEAPTLHTPKRSYRIRPAFIIAIIFSVVSVYFLRFTGNYPYKQELILIDRKTKQQVLLKVRRGSSSKDFL